MSNNKRGLTTLPDEMINWVDHGKVVSVMPTDNNEVQELIQGMPNGSLIVATNEEESNNSTVMKHGINVPILTRESLYFYVDANNGDDNNDGSINSPWKTINHSIYSIFKYKMTYNTSITIYITDGIYNENIHLIHMLGVLYIRGNSSNTIINGTISLGRHSTTVISNLTIQNSSNHCIDVGDAYLEIRDDVNIIQNDSSVAAISAANYANIVIKQSNLTISVTNSYAAFSSWRHSSIYLNESNITINGNVNQATFVCSTSSSIMFNNLITISGDVIGKKYLISTFSQIHSNGLVLPGTEEGNVHSGSYGYYV